jgi:hypothetical protein
MSRIFRFLIISFLCTGCFTTYPRYSQLKCDTLDPIAMLKQTGFTNITDSSATFRDRQINFNEIYRVSFAQKKKVFGLFGTDYRYILHFYNQQRPFSLDSPNEDLNHKAYSAWRCLAGIENERN